MVSYEQLWLARHMLGNTELVKDHGSKPSPISGCVIASLSLLYRVTLVTHPHKDTWCSGTRYCFKHVLSMTILQTGKLKFRALKLQGPDEL